MKVSKQHRANLYYYAAVFCAVWFALTAAAWTYLLNLFLALPFGIGSLVFWRKRKRIDERQFRYRSVLIILAAGAVISLCALAYFLMYG